MASKTRAFIAIGYPESMEENFIEILQETHVQAIISPLHNKDTNDDGELKKEHYHIMIMFDGPKTIDNAQKIFDKIKTTKCQPVNSVRGQARYLCHLDDPDKAEYDIGNVTCLNGADYISLIELPGNKYKAVREMMSWCSDLCIDSFAELFEYAAENEETWFRSLCDNSAYIMKEYLKSKSWQFRPYQSPRREDDD